jgi:hypothetical protein
MNGKMCKEANVAYFKVLSRHLSEETEENNGRTSTMTANRT